MASNQIISVYLFGQEIGKIGLAEDERRSSFQYHPLFLERNVMQNIFPQTGIIKRTPHVQLFNQFNGATFQGILPQFADSLPDAFGSLIFKTWLDSKQQKNISVLEQLAYVGNRGMGALEYRPVKKLPDRAKVDLDEIMEVLQKVLDLKKSSKEKKMNDQSLINIFRLGTSAGGVRPKILISESKEDGKIIPGDLEYSDKYNHYIVKLAMDKDYPREKVEYCYYTILRNMGIRMMDSKLIEDKHFATLRFDRQDGEKKHVLTATGITGWDYKDPVNSSYENLFKLSSYLKIPHVQMVELFKRMVFNLVYGNTDDHLKNHSFIYNQATDSWELSPAYDITFALNPLLNFKTSQRALSINGKRNNIFLKDVYTIAENYTIKNPKGIIKQVQSAQKELLKLFRQHNIPKLVSERINESIIQLI